MNGYYLVGSVMLLVGFILNYTINRRRFYRRGVGGLQHFKTYSGGLLTSLVERLGKIISLVLIVAGIITLILGWNEQSRIENRSFTSSMTNVSFLFS